MYGLDKPVATVVVKTGSSAATLVLGTTEAGKTFARDLSRAMVFTVDESMATDMAKARRRLPPQGGLRLPRLHRQGSRADPRRRRR